MISVVAIDGAAGSGKSTLARSLAEALGLPYVNTGLMYRALTRRALERDVSVEDGGRLSALVAELSFHLDASGAELEVDGYTTSDLESPEVDAVVSAVARHPAVRERLRALQRGIGERHGAVMEGRDIGSVVFPDADVKLFLVADPGVRAGRRSRDRDDDGRATAEALHRRDERDARTNPFEPAPGAVVLDTSAAEPDAVLRLALEIVAETAPGLTP